MEIPEKLKQLQIVLTEIDETCGKVTIINSGNSIGRLIEIYGAEPSERIAFTLIAIAAVQKAGGICAFIDVNHNLDRDFAEKLDVDFENLIISQPNDDAAMEIADNLIRSGAIDIVVISSISEL